MSVKFEDNSKAVKSALDEALIAGLYAAAAEIESQAAQNSPVDTGQLKGSWAHKVDENKMEAVIGSPLEYAIYQEFGTGEYAYEGKGRKGGWRYQDAKGEWHFTKGNKPVRMLWNAFHTKRHTIQKIFENELKEAFKGSSTGGKASVKQNSNGLKVNIKGAVNKVKQQYKKAESALEKMEK